MLHYLGSRTSRFDLHLNKFQNQDESSNQSDMRAHVIEVATGRVLVGEEAPFVSQLDAWLEMHPGYEVAPRDENTTSHISDECSQSEIDSEEERQLDEEEKNAQETIEKLVTKTKTDDDEYSKCGLQSYYAIAHSTTEEITQQSSNLVNGQLKEYQVCVTYTIVLESYFTYRSSYNYLIFNNYQLFPDICLIHRNITSRLLFYSS